MTDASAFSPCRRKDDLAGVPADRRAAAERLCELLEDAFELVGRAFRTARQGAGHIRATDARERERARSAVRPARKAKTAKKATRAKSPRRPARKA